MATVYSDVFGSVERRRRQEERDDAERARPVMLLGARLALRSPEERATTPREKTVAEREARWLRKQLRKGRLNKAQVRRAIASTGGRSSPIDR